MRDVTPPMAASAMVIMRIMDRGEWKPNPPALRDESWSAPLAVKALVSLSLSHQGSWSVGRGRHGVVRTGAVRGGGSGSALHSSRCAFCSRDMRLKVSARVQSARFGIRGRPGGVSGVISAAAVRAGARGCVVCPNLLQRSGSRRSAERESLIFRAFVRRGSRPGAPLQQIWTRPRPQGVGKVGLGDWLGDQVDGSSGASGHGSGGGGDGGSGAVEESDEADGEVAQGGRDQRGRWRCAAGGGPRP